MSIPLTYFLYAYYVFLVVWALIFLVGLYHMLKFGFKGLLTVVTTGIIIGVAVLMLFFSFYYINSIDYWDESFQIFPEINNESINI
jgi:hypothetical protein